MILIEKKWKDPLPSERPDGVPFSRRLLLSRGVSDEEVIRAFLSPESIPFPDPMTFPDMEIACARIVRAVQNREKILIYGDYDADGVTATALLTLFLRKAGASSCEYLIPDRLSEGYGVSESLFARIREMDPKVLITVDCGIANITEIDALGRTGIDVIVTDHHEVKETLPRALAVLNAKRKDSIYAFPHLSGVGVALKLIQALSRFFFPGDDEKWRAYLDLAAIGTVADVVSVEGENRTLIRLGLEAMNRSPRPGILALLSAGGQAGREITTGSIGYCLVPRINASGRMGDAGRAVELLMTDDKETAERLSAELTVENQRRQDIEAGIFAEAVQQFENANQAGGLSSAGPILVRGSNWHPGVIGIVAARLVGRYGRSAIVLTEESGQKGILKGSARAAESENILLAIASASASVVQYGGHPKAAGVAVAMEKYDAFARAIGAYAETSYVEPEEAGESIDFAILPEEITLETCREIRRLSPFGEGNPEPRFLLRGARIAKSASCGNDGRHLKLRIAAKVGEDGREEEFDGIAFGLGECAELYEPGVTADFIVSPTISVWRDRESISLQVLDIRFPKTGKLAIDRPYVLEELYRNRLGLRELSILAKTDTESLLPQKDEYKCVYQFLRTHCASGLNLCDITLLSHYISVSYKLTMNGFVLARILEVFEEAGLLRIYSVRGGRYSFSLLFVEGKVKLESTTTYRRLSVVGRG